MGKLVVVGDIHGDITKLNVALDKVNQELTQPEDVAIFLGDYIDRGKQNLGVVNKLIEYKKDNNVLFLQGNHDYEFVNNVRFYGNFYGMKDFFRNESNWGNNTSYIVLERTIYQTLSFMMNYQKDIFKECVNYISKQCKGKLTEDETERLLGYFESTDIENLVNMGRLDAKTMEEVSFDLRKLSQLIMTEMEDIYNFLDNALCYIETDKYIISHSGGVKTDLPEDNTRRDWVWARQIIKGIHTDKVFIIGHQPTRSGEVEEIKSTNHILVDTGAIFREVDIGVYVSKYDTLSKYNDYGNIEEQLKDGK